MNVGQRALFLWLLTFSSLVFLTLHLDFGIDLLICFVFLWLTDLSTLCFALLRCARVTRFDEGPNLSFAFVAQIVAKFVFEVLLFVQLKYNMSRNLFLTMLPAWACLILVICILSSRIYRFAQSI